MTYVIEHYDPRADKYYTSRAGNPEAAEQLKKVLEHLGMKEVTVFEEPDEVINNKKTETEYFIGLRKLQAKEKEVISRYQAARTEYFRVKNEHNEIMHEIQKYKESYGVYQSVR